jgi:hypothetical protein
MQFREPIHSLIPLFFLGERRGRGRKTEKEGGCVAAIFYEFPSLGQAHISFPDPRRGIRKPLHL